MTDLGRIRPIIDRARADGRSFLLEPQALELLSAIGIAVPRWRFVPSPGSRAGTPEPRLPVDAFPGDRIVVKAVAGGLVHKTEVGAVRVVPRDHHAVSAAMGAMARTLQTAPDPAAGSGRGAAGSGRGAAGSAAGDLTGAAVVGLEGFLLAEFVEHDLALGSELLLSIRWTDDCGPIVSVGAGGILTEALAADLRPGREIAVLSPALTPRDRIGEVLSRVTAVRLATTSQRGQPPRLPLDRLVAVVDRLLEVAAEVLPVDLLELEINPAAVTEAGLVALDVLVRIGAGPARVEQDAGVMGAAESGGFTGIDTPSQIPGASHASPRPIHKIEHLLRPRSVGIIGVSSGTNPGHVILSNLLREGFEPDRIVVVKPGVDAIDGVRCVPDVASLPDRLDLFVVAVSAAQAPGVVADVIERDLAESLVVIPGGLEEKQGGGELADRMRASLAMARTRPDGGPLLNGGNCLGIRSRPGRIDTLFIPTYKLPRGEEPAPIALITGSGAFAVTRLSRLGRLDPRYVVTLGNQTDLTVGDYLTYLAGGLDERDVPPADVGADPEARDADEPPARPGDEPPALVGDPEVRVIGVYVEGFRPLDGLRSLQAAARLTAHGRVIVLYRAGRTTAGVSASASHTASIAGDATVTRELARQAGVVWSETPEAFDDLVRLFVRLDGRHAAGRRLGAVTNAGSECVTIADHLGSLELAPFSASTEAALASILAGSGIDSVVDVHDPLDLTPIADATVYESVARTVLGADEVDIGLVGIVPITDTLEALEPDADHPEDLDRAGGLVDRMGALWRSTSKPWVAVVDGGRIYDAFADRLDAAGIPTFRTADAALRALGAYVDWLEDRHA